MPCDGPSRKTEADGRRGGKDKLPPGLRRQLRMNRRGASLPDCAADMWMQLVQAEQEEEGSLFDDDKKATEQRIRSFLRLGSKDAFPVGRVVTLWRNRRWRGMLTRWYGTQLGRETLPNVSTCEWMASLQIDGVSTPERVWPDNSQREAK